MHASEYQVKAAFILNILKFVEWPPQALTSPKEPLAIGILGKDPFKGALTQIIRGQTIGGRSIVICRSNQFEDVKNCPVLFISSSHEKSLEFVLESLKGKSVLTIGDIASFSQRGGMIGFFTQENKIRFQINLQAAENVGLKISSKLLKLAQNVMLP